MGAEIVLILMLIGVCVVCGLLAVDLDQFGPQLSVIVGAISTIFMLLR